MDVKDSFEVNWCEKHHTHFIGDCANCMIDSNEPEILDTGMQRVVDWIHGEISENRLTGGSPCYAIRVDSFETFLKDNNLEGESK